MKVHVCGILDRYLKSSNLFETILRGISITSRIIATSKHEALPKIRTVSPILFLPQAGFWRVQLCQAYPRRVASASFAEAGQNAAGEIWVPGTYGFKE